MVSAAMFSLCAFFTFFAILQPCPAPPVFAFAATAAASLAGGSAGISGGALLAGGAASAAGAAVGAGVRAGANAGSRAGSQAGGRAEGGGAAKIRKSLSRDTGSESVDNIGTLLEEFRTVFEKGHTTRRDESLTEQLGNCMDDATVDPRMIIYRDYTIVLSGLPPSCMSEIEEYNAQPDIANLNSRYGQATIINNTAVYIFNIPSEFNSYIVRLAALIE